MKVNSSDSLLRYAIYEAHGFICFYTKKPLKFIDMNLDHIIPKSLAADPAELRRVKAELSLPDEFDLDDLENILPCHFLENRDKQAIILPGKEIHLANARLKKQVIIDGYRKLREQKRTEKDFLTKGRSQIERQIVSAEEAHYLLTGKRAIFREFESYVDDINHGSYCASKGRVYLWGWLPSLRNGGASCQITFKSLEVSGLYMTLNQEDIALLDNEEHKKRTLEREADGRNSPELKGKVFFLFGGTGFFIDPSEAHEFYNLIHTFHKRIQIGESNIREHFGASRFEFSKGCDGYRLGRVKKGLWQLLMRFTKDFDLDKGHTEWHIFDARPNTLIISSTEHQNEWDAGFHSNIIPESVSSDGIWFPGSDNEIFLVWNKIQPNEGRYSDKAYWNANITYRFLADRLIPYVVWYSQHKARKGAFRLFRREQRYENFLKEFKIEDYLW